MRKRHRTLTVKIHLKEINVKQPALSLSLSLSLFHSKIIAKLETTLGTAHNKTRTIHTNHTNNGGNNKQCINNSKTSALERSVEINVGLSYLFCHMFAVDSAVTCQRENKSKARVQPFYGASTHRLSAKETPHLSHGGPSQRQTSDTDPLIKVVFQGRHRVRSMTHREFFIVQHDK